MAYAKKMTSRNTKNEILEELHRVQEELSNRTPSASQVKQQEKLTTALAIKEDRKEISISAIEGVTNSLVTQAKQIVEQIKSLEEELNTLKEERVTLTEEINRIHKIEVKACTIDAVAETLDRKKSEIEEYELSKVQEAAAKIRELERQYEDKSEELEANHRRRTLELELEFKEKKTELEQNAKDVDQLRIELDQLKKSFEAEIERITTKAKADKATAISSALHTLKLEHSAQTAKQEADIEHLKIENSKLETANAKLEERLNETQKQVSDIAKASITGASQSKVIVQNPSDNGMGVNGKR